MYNNGMSPNIVAFYPPINYPVSRKTQTLHSIFPWDHSETWVLKSMIQGVSFIIFCIDYLNNTIVIYL
jgi:hypothetical protein